MAARTKVGLFLALLTASAGTALYLLLSEIHIPDLAAALTRLQERATAVAQAASPTYASERLKALPDHPLNGPVIHLEDHLPAAPTSEQPLSPLAAWELNGADPIALEWNGAGSTVQKPSGLLIQQAGTGHLTHRVPVEIPAQQVGEIWIRMRVSQGTRARLSWEGEDPAVRPWKDAVEIPLMRDEGFHTYRVQASLALMRGLSPGESIRKILFKPTDHPQGTAEIDFIRFLSKHHIYGQQAWGTTYETLSGDTRSAIFLHGGASVRIPLRVPPASPSGGPRLTWAWGYFAGQPAVEPQIAIGERVLFAPGPVASGAAGRWHEAVADLSPWAGQEVSLELRARGPQDGLLLLGHPTVASPPTTPRHVILLVEDTLRADRHGWLGHPRRLTPLKDTLAADGIRFHRAYAPACKTRPSVASLFTSLTPVQTGVWSLRDFLPDTYLTLAELMRASGFITWSFIQNGNAGPYAGLHQGFERVLDPQLLSETPEQAVAVTLREVLPAMKSRNVFLYLHLVDPHGPYVNGEPVAGVEPGSPVPVNPTYDPSGLQTTTTGERVSRYEGEVRNNDAALATLVEGLRAHGLVEDTLLILTSDHGEYLGEEGRWGHNPPSLAPVVHVPLVMYGSSLLPPPRAVETPVGLMDLMPTILELTHVPTSGLVMMGESLLPLMRGEPSRRRPIPSDEPTAMSPAEPRPLGTVHLGPWSLTYTTNTPFHDASRQPVLRVFHQERGELEPPWGMVATLAAQRQERLQQEQLAFDQFTAGSTEVVPSDPVVTEHLRSLGYVE